MISKSTTYLDKYSSIASDEISFHVFVSLLYKVNPKPRILLFIIWNRAKSTKYPMGLLSSPPRGMKSQEHTALLLFLPNIRVITRLSCHCMLSHSFHREVL